MNSLLFGFIFMQVSIFFVAAFILMTILYKALMNRDEKAAERGMINSIRPRHYRRISRI